MKKRIDVMGMVILIALFILFYFITSIFLDNIKNDVVLDNDNITSKDDNKTYEEEKNIVNSLYQDVRILYDVVNNKFKVDQEDVIVINDINYKLITNFNEVINNIFTASGRNKYINDLGSYFAIRDEKYYLAGNLVTYQTYYFRGDNSNIYIVDANDNEINAIIYERWSSNNKNTLATIKVVNKDGKWLIDNIDILSTE